MPVHRSSVVVGRFDDEPLNVEPTHPSFICRRQQRALLPGPTPLYVPAQSESHIIALSGNRKRDSCILCILDSHQTFTPKAHCPRALVRYYGSQPKYPARKERRKEPPRNTSSSRHRQGYTFSKVWEGADKRETQKEREIDIEIV